MGERAVRLLISRATMRPSAKPRPIVLAVEDDPGVLAAFHLILDDEYEVFDASDGVAGLAAITCMSIDVVLLDLVMEGLDGVLFLEQLRKTQINTPVIVVSALQHAAVAATVMRLGATDY